MRRNIRSLWLALGLLMAATVSVTAQTAPTPIKYNTVFRPRFVIMDDYIRDILAADWDKHAKDKPLLERSYCIKYQRDFWAGEDAYRVTQISKPEWEDASVSGIESADCGPGDNVAEIHIHPAQTCSTDEGPCWPGGPYAYQCQPSDNDRRYLSYVRHRFGMVQCDRNAVVFYWPMGDNR